MNMKDISLVCFAVLMLLCSCGKESFEERVSREVKDFNEKEAPKRVDQYTTMDSMTWNIQKRTITYYYTMSGIADDPTLITDEVKEAMHDQLLDNIRVSIQLKPYKEQGLNFEYKYFSKKSGKTLYRARFTTKDY